MGQLFAKPPQIQPPYVRPLCSAADGSPILWTIRGNQKFLGFSIQSFGLIARLSPLLPPSTTTSTSSSSSSLAVINPVELSKGLLEEVGQLEKETKCRLETIYSPGDWHHLHLQSWSTAFPDAKVYVASERVARKQPQLAHRFIILNRLKPHIPELAADFDLLPILGCQQPAWILGGDAHESPRVEQVVFHRLTRTLFITDHVFAPTKGEQSAQQDKKDDRKDEYQGPTPNTGGFRIFNPTLAAQSAQAVLALNPRRLVFAHGTEDTFVVDDDNSDNNDSNPPRPGNQPPITVVDQLRGAYHGHYLPKEQANSDNTNANTCFPFGCCCCCQ